MTATPTTATARNRAQLLPIYNAVHRGKLCWCVTFREWVTPVGNRERAEAIAAERNARIGLPLTDETAEQAAALAGLLPEPDINRELAEENYDTTDWTDRDQGGEVNE